jgi:hypothetical protein
VVLSAELLRVELLKCYNPAHLYPTALQNGFYAVSRARNILPQPLFRLRDVDPERSYLGVRAIGLSHAVAPSSRFS